MLLHSGVNNMAYEKVVYEVKDRIAYISINSPRTMNAINDLIIEELVQAITEAEHDESVRVMVLSGVGKAFCAGGELGSFKQGLEDGTIDMGKNMRNSARLPILMKTSAKPIIAAVRGPAAGAGCSLALCSDFCIASENAKFLEAFVGVGLIPDTGGVYALAKAVGATKAVQLCMTGEPIKADRALELGMVYKVVPDEELDGAVLKLASRLAAGPSSCYKAIKEIAWEIEWKDFEEYCALEEVKQAEVASSPNFREGVFAFLEKRPAKFI